MKAAEILQGAGQKTALAVFGMSIHEVSFRNYERMGGTLLLGDRVTGGNFDGDRLISVCTANLGSIRMNAANFIIATGKFFGKGLVADMNRIYEPVFGLDVRYEADRSKWFDPDFKASQPFLGFGVITDEQGHPFINGQRITNLFACGELLEGMTCAQSDDMSAVIAGAEKVANTIMEEWPCRSTI